MVDLSVQVLVCDLNKYDSKTPPGSALDLELTFSKFALGSVDSLTLYATQLGTIYNRELRQGCVLIRWKLLPYSLLMTEHLCHFSASSTPFPLHDCGVEIYLED